MNATSKSLKLNIYSHATLCCLGFMMFSFFIRYNFPLIIFSFLGLTLPAFIISKQVNSIKDLIEIFGFVFPKKIVIYLIIGLQLGLIYAMIYRGITDLKLFPGSLTGFAITAALIGAIEELIFRGFLQGLIRKKNMFIALIFATFSHTAYKCCLFLSPANEMQVNIPFLFLWTFIGGLLFGVLKEISKSVVPAVLAHAFFDILVYGECLKPPWWVW